jgi:hypothetical protein
MDSIPVHSPVLVTAAGGQHPVARIGEGWVENFHHPAARGRKHHFGRGKPIKSTTYFGWEEAKAIQLLQN